MENEYRNELAAAHARIETLETRLATRGLQGARAESLRKRAATLASELALARKRTTPTAVRRLALFTGLSFGAVASIPAFVMAFSDGLAHASIALFIATVPALAIFHLTRKNEARASAIRVEKIEQELALTQAILEGGA